MPFGWKLKNSYHIDSQLELKVVIMNAYQQGTCCPWRILLRLLEWASYKLHIVVSRRVVREGTDLLVCHIRSCPKCHLPTLPLDNESESLNKPPNLLETEFAFSFLNIYQYSHLVFLDNVHWAFPKFGVHQVKSS